MTSKKADTKKDAVILYPIFLECKDYTLDPFWIDIFIQCSRGKFPKGMRITSEGTIIIQHGKEKEIVPLKGEPVDIFKNLMYVFKNKLGLISNRDQFKKKQNLEKVKQDYLDNYDGTWKQIKPKRIRDKLILDFVLNEKEKRGLNDKQTEYLLSLINLGFLFKIITSDDVDYSDRKIHSIDGVEYDKKSKTYIYTNDTTKELKSEKNTSTNKMCNYIEKYIKVYKDNRNYFRML